MGVRAFSRILTNSATGSGGHETIDKQRACYLKHYYDVDWADATPYHLVVNTSLMRIEQEAKVIITAVHHLENDTSGTPG